MKSKTFILVFSLWSLVLGLFGCQPKIKGEKTQEVIPVRVLAVIARDLNETLEYVGDIKAEDEVVVYPKVSGKITEKVKQDGAPINKGEAVAYIDRDEVGLKFQRAPVESPLSGIVGRVYVDIGQNVTNQTAVALVLDMNQVKINLDIPEKYLPQISLGQEAKISVDAYAQEEFIGKVTKVSPVVNLENRAAPIEIIIDNPEHLLQSGMFAKVNLIIAEHKNVPVVLKEAILGREPDFYVYAIENKKAISKKVKLGIHQGPYYEIRDGLKEGDLVVVMGQQRLFDGASVITEEEK
jgi:multidrug efflux pump subunit AcrA (membrane-fusion protein)